MTKKRLLKVSVLLLLLVGITQIGSAQTHVLRFPLGLMGPSGDTPPELGAELVKLEDVASAGFNFVFEFRSNEAPWEARQYLSRARNEGLQVVQNLPACRAYVNDIPECLDNPVPLWTDAQWVTFIQAAAPFDNLVGWYLPDEIDDLTAAANLARLVRNNDPRHRPIYANPGSRNLADIERFTPFTDFLWAVCYPHLMGEPRAFTTHMMKLDAQAVEGTDIKWGAVLQFFDSRQFPDYGRQGAPTARELRSDTYQAIIGGATGLWYFNYEMGKADGLDALWDEMVTIRNQIIGGGQLDDIILAPDVADGVGRRILSGPTQSPRTEGQTYDSIQYLAKWHRYRGTHIFAVNIAEETVQVEFNNLWAGADRVQVLFEGRSIPILDDAFTDTFAPNDVHIYRYGASEPSEPLARLGLSLQAAPDPVLVEDAVTYTLAYSNGGPSEAEDVTITSSMPAGVTFGGVVSAAPALPAPTVSPGAVSWQPGTLAAGASGTIVYTATVETSAPDTITSIAQVDSSTHDDDMSDNQDEASTRVTQASDLVVTVSGEPDSVLGGVPVSYAVTVTNHGPSEATGVTLTDWLPEDVTVTSVVTSEGSCIQTGTQLACDLGTMARDHTVTVDMVVVPQGAGDRTNIAYVTGNEFDPDLSNNTATAETKVRALIYLPLTMKGQ